MLRSLRRTNPSSVRNVFWWLCLKYSNQPRSVRFTSAMVWDMLRPEDRLVFARIVPAPAGRARHPGGERPRIVWAAAAPRLRAPTPTICDKVGAGLRAFAHRGGYGLPPALQWQNREAGTIYSADANAFLMRRRISIAFSQSRLLATSWPRLRYLSMRSPSIRFVKLACRGGIRPPCGRPGNLLPGRHLQDCRPGRVAKNQGMSKPAC
jgi:hypothetical protein